MGSIQPLEIESEPIQQLRDAPLCLIDRDRTESYWRERYQTLRAEHAALEDAYEVLRTSDQAQQELALMIVHDLKVPLSVVQSVLDLIGIQADRGMGNDLGEMLRLANQACHEILQLITNLLELRRIEAGEMPLLFQPVDVALILRTVVRGLTPLTDGSDVQMHLTLAPGAYWAWADANLVARVITNLVDNAIRFSFGEGQVIIACQDAQRMLQISVADHGPGIPEGLQGRIFDPFVQAAENPLVGGSNVGLGLAFCKAAVEAQGGRIWVESGSPSSTRFVFTLPCWQHDMDYPTPGHSQPSTPTRPGACAERDL